MKKCTENAIFYTFLGEMIAKHVKNGRNSNHFCCL